ncbi:MAG TPA: hypothetical protein VFC65_12990 [Prolixibacteraceae bacterium]|nr:hypothetical protein [Prolixibacteraceae bacterium]
MKKLLTILICLSLIIGTLSAQTPNAFKYQAVVRDNAGQIIINQNVGFRISILQSSATGTAIYSETHAVQTNAFGLVNFEIGMGTVVSGTFSTIDWGSDSYFVKIELDATNSGSFSEMGTSQLLAVPYALYATKAGNGLTISGTPQLGDLLYNNGDKWDLLSKGVNGQTLRLDNGLPNWGEPGYALPMVTTSAVTDVLQTGAMSGGNIIATGFTDITARGVCWGINQNPTTVDSKTTEGTGIGTFTSSITSLESNTTYYLRAYATNSAGTTYGNQVTFKTILNVVFPTTITAAVTNITANAVTSGGSVTATGGGEVTARGVCWSDHQNPTISDSKTSDGTGTGEFQSQISGLLPGTYYARAYATNSAGTGYGNMVTFTTEKTLPVLTTKAITDISAMGAVSGGSISSAGGGTISGRGICWSDAPNPTIDNEKTTSTSTSSSFSAAIAKASPSTTYYLKAYATNEIGTGYGDEKTFTTSDAAYYTSFEAGMTPANWTGPWTVRNEAAFDGSYSFKSLVSQTSETSFNFTLSQTGQLSFYFFLYDGYGGITLEVYLDDELMATYPGDGSGWRQGLIDILTGTHALKFKLLQQGAFGGDYCYIDQITITK